MYSYKQAASISDDGGKGNKSRKFRSSRFGVFTEKSVRGLPGGAVCASGGIPGPGCNPLTKEKEGSFFRKLRPGRAQTLKLREESERAMQKLDFAAQR
jgi:hypothetical protein